MGRFDQLLAEARPHRGAVGWSKEKEAAARAWAEKYYSQSVSGSVEKDYKAGNVKVVHADEPGKKLAPDEKMVFGKVRKVGKKTTLSAAIKKANDKNAPPGGWTDADKVESRFDRAAGLSEDHDPADGAKLRDLVGKISMSVAAHEAAKSMEECSKHVAAIKTALDEMNPIVDRL